MTIIQKMKTCPRCRGYRLESQWCQVCGGSGYVPDGSERRVYGPTPPSDGERPYLEGYGFVQAASAIATPAATQSITQVEPKPRSGFGSDAELGHTDNNGE